MKCEYYYVDNLLDGDLSTLMCVGMERGQEDVVVSYFGNFIKLVVRGNKYLSHPYSNLSSCH